MTCAPTFFCSDMRNSREVRFCCECGDVIGVGDPYQYARGIWDGEFDHFQTCVSCFHIRQFAMTRLAESPEDVGFTQLREFIESHVSNLRSPRLETKGCIPGNGWG